MKRLTIATIAALLLLAGSAPAAKNPLELTSQTTVRDRLLQLEFTTPAMADGAAAARVLLPPGYDESKRDYPVIYLLHGAGYDETAWSEEGRVEEIVGDRKAIVVMPNGGGNGYYTDWYNGGAFGPPAYETFHIGQLLPYIDKHFRTVDERGGRVVAGFSMSGFGAMSYAARYPDLFSGAFSFSGAIDTNFAPFQGIGESSSLADGGQYAAIWGPRQTQEVRWRAKNPWDLAINLKGMTLQIYTGNGAPGPFDSGTDLNVIELGINIMSHSVHDRLDELGIPHLFNDYGAGTHTFPYYSRDLEWSLPAMMDTFKDPPAPPKTFTYRRVEPKYTVYGYDVSFKRPVLEFSELTARANGKRFQLTGSGTARVKTPPTLKPRTRYDVSVKGAADEVERSLKTDGKGRLSLRVSLGKPNEFQEYTAEAAGAGGTVVRQATVRVSR